MIKMIKGTYGYELPDGTAEAKTPKSPPFSIDPAREAELVELGVAVKVEDPEEDLYKGKSMTELRKMAQKRGVDVKAIKSKSGMIAALRESVATKQG